jgi:mRNA-degrading endonuclease RelE of RelBE toxin-antitoxin system
MPMPSGTGNPLDEVTFTKALIASKLKELAQDPYAIRNVKKLANRLGYRLGIGDWRVLYSSEVDASRIVGIDIAPRGGVYS